MTRVACSPALEASMDLVQAICSGVGVGVGLGVGVGVEVEVGVGVGPSDLPQRRQPVSPSDGTKGLC